MRACPGPRRPTSTGTASGSRRADSSSRRSRHSRRLQQLAKTLDPSLQGGFNALTDLIAVAEPIVAARLAATERRDADAIALLEQAVAAEDKLAYDEPADWFFPARHLLGAQLLLAGRARGCGEGLPRGPEAQSRQRLGAVRPRRSRCGPRGTVPQRRAWRSQQARAWQHADVRLPASAFWYAGVDSASCECQHLVSQNRQPGGVLLGAQHEAGVD